MRSADEIYQDLKEKYGEELSNSNNDKKIKISKEGILSAITLIALWALLIFLVFVFYATRENDESLLSFLFLIKEIILLAVILAFITIKRISSSRNRNKQVTQRNKSYKETVIADLVKEICPALTYVGTSQVSEVFYKKAYFENYDEFKSEDAISGSLEGVKRFEIVDVLTEKVIKGDNGIDTHYPSFSGLFSYSISPFNLTDTVKIYSSNSLGLSSGYGNRINMDSTTFEKYFNVFADNSLLCMELLTADVLDILVKFREETKIQVDIIIKESFIFIRYHLKDMFEVPNNFEEPINKKEIENIISTLSSIIKLNIDINKIFENKHISIKK